MAWPHAAPNFPSLPQRLGIVYCFNRPCALWAARAPNASAAGGKDSGSPASIDAPTVAAYGAADAAASDAAAADAAAAAPDAADAKAAKAKAAVAGFSGQQEAVQLTGQLPSAFSPRFAPGGDSLVFLSQHAACDSGVHNGTTSVHSLAWNEVRST